LGGGGVAAEEEEEEEELGLSTLHCNASHDWRSREVRTHTLQSVEVG